MVIGARHAADPQDIARPLVLVFALLASACGSTDDSQSAGGSAASTKLSLVAYSTPKEVYEEIIPAFTKTPVGRGAAEPVLRSLEVRVDGVLGDGSPVPILVTRDLANQLELRAGQLVWLRVHGAREFAA